MSNDSRVLSPAAEIRGAVTLPGDKSVSHRVAMLSGLASGTSTLEGFLTSEDCLNSLKAIETLGARVRRDGSCVTVTGTGGSYQQPVSALDMGNSGTGIRLLAGLLAGQAFTSELTGDVSLRSRPMKRIKDPLEKMGAKVELLGANGCAPIRLTGGSLKGIEYPLPVASAQVKSCTLLAGLFADGVTTVIEPEETRDHTEIILRAMGVPVKTDGLVVTLKGFGAAGPRIRAGTWTVPGDFSSAAFWLVAAAAREGADVTVKGVGLNPRRTALLNVLQRMGADVMVMPVVTPAGWEAIGDIRVRGCRLAGTEIGGAEIPNLIDEIPILCIAAALADGRTVIRDAGELRVKESDRIATMAAGLERMGVKVETHSDGMTVDGGRPIRGGLEIDSFDDHRIAMSFAVLALSADAPVRILKTWCIATSYPGFWEHLNQLTGQHVE